MRSLADIRKALGGAPDYTDEQLVTLVHQVYKPYYPDFNEFASKVGYDTSSDFGRGLQIGGKGVKGALAGAGAWVAGRLGADELQQSAFDVQAQAGQEAYQLGREYDDPAKSWRNPTGFLAGAAGQVIPSAGVALGSYATGGVLGGALGLGRAGALTAGAGTSFGTNLLMETGDIYGMQHEQGIDKPAQALGYGAAAAGLDTATELFGIGRAVRGTRGGLRGARNAALQQGAVEAGTEVAQTGLERLGADLPLSDDTSGEEYRRAAALGAVGGGMFGAVTGLRKSPGITVEAEPDLLHRGEIGADDVPAAPAAGQPPPGIQPVILEDALPVATTDLAETAQPPLMPVPQEPEPPAEPTVQDDVKARIAQRQQEIDAAGQRAGEFGLKAPKQVELFEELEKLRTQEAISQAEFEEQLVDLGVNKLGAVRSFVKRILNAVEGQESVKAKQAAEGAKNVGVAVPAGGVSPEGGGQPGVDATGSVADPGRVSDAVGVAGAGVARLPGAPGAAPVPVRGSRDQPTPDLKTDRYAPFDKRTLSQKFTISETGEEAELRRDAGKTLRDLDSRESALRALKDCLSKGG